MKSKIHDFFQAVFIITLIIYIGIWLTVSYVGVYVTYVAGPILLISGLFMYIFSPKEGKDQKI